MILVRFVRRSPPSITAAHPPLHCSIPSPAAPGDAPGREPALPETIILVQIHINMLRPQAAAIHPSPPSTIPRKTSTFLSPQPQTRRVCAGSGSGAEDPPLPRPAALTRPPALPVLCLSLEPSGCPWVSPHLPSAGDGRGRSAQAALPGRSRGRPEAAAGRGGEKAEPGSSRQSRESSRQSHGSSRQSCGSSRWLQEGPGKGPASLPARVAAAWGARLGLRAGPHAGEKRGVRVKITPKAAMGVR